MCVALVLYRYTLMRRRRTQNEQRLVTQRMTELLLRELLNCYKMLFELNQRYGSSGTTPQQRELLDRIIVLHQQKMELKPESDDTIVLRKLLLLRGCDLN